MFRPVANSDSPEKSCVRFESLALSCCSAALAGCGTTRVSDTSRTATEMLLVSRAVDESVGQLDFSALRGKSVYLDTQHLTDVVDKGYIVSSLRQHALAHGALLQDDKLKAQYVLEPRSGGVGTDRHSLLFGVPQMSVPALAPGQPTQIPEIALMKKTDQKGVAKLAVFAYDRTTGRALWQSGTIEAESRHKDTWVFGAGPFSRGTARPETQLAGENLPRFALPFRESPSDPENEPVHVSRPTEPRFYPAKPEAASGITAVAGTAIAGESPQP